MEEDRREHFRLVYPEQQRGFVKLYGHPYPIQDISQKGIKIIVEEPNAIEEWQLDTAVEAIVFLVFGAKIHIKAKVLRIEEEYVVFYLEDPIPFKTMIEEQRFLIKEFVNAQSNKSPESDPSRS